MKNGRPTTLGPAWAALVSAYGGVTKFAALLEVSPMTLWRWGQASHEPLAVTAKLIAKLAKKKKLSNPLERR